MRDLLISQAATHARAIRVGIFVVVAVALSLLEGVPLDRNTVFVVCGLGVLVASSPRRLPVTLARFVWDWLPLAVLLVLYDYSRGAAAHLGSTVRYAAPAQWDKWLFGGSAPTVWLQARLYTIRHIVWWEAILSLLYVSHFIVPYVVMATLWVRDHDAWRRYRNNFVIVTAVALVLFILRPTAPPWLDSQLGYVGHVIRTAGDGWTWLHLHQAGTIVHEGQSVANTVAAFPSLHAAYPLLITFTLWPRTQRRLLRAMLVVYPIAMGFMLVATGEHWATDVLGAWVIVVAVCGAPRVIAAARRRSRSQSEARSASGPASGPAPRSASGPAPGPASGPRAATTGPTPARPTDAATPGPGDDRATDDALPAGV